MRKNILFLVNNPGVISPNTQMFKNIIEDKQLESYNVFVLYQRNNNIKEIYSNDNFTYYTYDLFYDNKKIMQCNNFAELIKTIFLKCLQKYSSFLKRPSISESYLLYRKVLEIHKIHHLDLIIALESPDKVRSYAIYMIGKRIRSLPTKIVWTELPCRLQKFDSKYVTKISKVCRSFLVRKRDMVYFRKCKLFCKLIACEYPLKLSNYKEKNEFNNNDILYFGHLYKNFEKFNEMIDFIKLNSNYLFKFYLTNYEEITLIKDIFPKNVILLKPKPIESLYKEISKCKWLLSIERPTWVKKSSKYILFLSTGKPIIYFDNPNIESCYFLNSCIILPDDVDTYPLCQYSFKCYNIDYDNFNNYYPDLSISYILCLWLV